MRRREEKPEAVSIGAGNPGLSFREVAGPAWGEEEEEDEEAEEEQQPEVRRSAYVDDEVYIRETEVHVGETGG